MNKKKLRLSTVLTLKEDLEQSIKHTEESIIRYNSTDKKIDGLLERLDAFERQLEKVKEVIQSANRLKHPNKKTNNYYIYRLSSLMNRKRFYGTRLVRAIRDTEKAQINKIIAAQKRKDLQVEISAIKKRLTEFNEKKSITLEIDESLNLNV